MLMDKMYRTHRKASQMLRYHNRQDGKRLANHASTPQVRPPLPTARPRQATTGTRSSHIQDVPHSDTHKLARNTEATNATGRVSKPRMSKTPSEISVNPCSGAANAAWLAAIPMTHFQAAGEWLFSM